MTVTSKILEAMAQGTVFAVGHAPTRIQRLIGGHPPVSDGVTIEPEVGAILRLLAAVPGPTFEDLPLAQGRAQIDDEATLFGGPQIPMAEVRDVTIPTPTGSIPGRLYRAEARDADRLVVYFHGGGWVVGSLTSVDSACRFLAKYSGASVLAVDYRLAPEHRFPAAPDDALAAFRFAVAQAEAWGHDPNRIAVAGDSAGGNLAAVLCQDLRTSDEVRPAFQLLFFPVTDLSAKTRSYELFADGFFLTESQMDWYKAHYLGDHPATDPRVSPLLAPDLSGLPPAYIAVSGFDVLRDEGEAYARALAAAGCTVALRRHERLIHAFVNSTGVGTSSREAFLEACGALRAGIGAGTAPR